MRAGLLPAVYPIMRRRGNTRLTLPRINSIASPATIFWPEHLAYATTWPIRLPLKPMSLVAICRGPAGEVVDLMRMQSLRVNRASVT